jgi:hypothetical protein
LASFLAPQAGITANSTAAHNAGRAKTEILPKTDFFILLSP